MTLKEFIDELTSEMERNNWEDHKVVIDVTKTTYGPRYYNLSFADITMCDTGILHIDVEHEDES